MAAATPRRVAAALVDLNGTLHVGVKPIGDAAKSLRRLRSAGVPLRFVTNTTKEATSSLVQTVRRAGIELDESEVFSSLRAARALVVQRGLRPLLLLHPDALPEFEGVDTSRPNAVVLGLAKEEFSYSNLNAAFRLLLDDPSAPLIAIHKGRYYKDPEDGLLSLGPGPFAAALEFASGRAAEVVGKPEPAFFRMALASLGEEQGGDGGDGSSGGGLAADECVMVGDDVQDDVGGAQALGMRGVLVRTGKYRPGDESSRGVSPAFVADDFGAAVDWILAQGR